MTQEENEIRAALRRKHEMLDDAQEHFTIVKLEADIVDLQDQLALIAKQKAST